MKKDNVKNVITFQLFMGVLLMFLGTCKLNAQLKVGSNPKTLAPNVLFEIESNTGKAAVFTKDSAFLGLGTLVPTRRLDIQNGNNPGAIKIVDGTQGLGKVLTSDANGVGTWTTPFTATPQNLTNSNGIIVYGGTGATLTAASLRLDSAAIAKLVTQNPVKDSIIRVMNMATTNVLTAGSNAITNTTNGVVATLTPLTGTLTTKFLGFDASGNLVTDTATTSISNGLTSSVNTITSTVNGVVASAAAVNSVVNSFNATTRELTTTVNGVAATAVAIPTVSDSTSASNGLTLNGKDVKLGGALSGATTITTTATNTLSLAGLQSGTLGDSLVVADATTGALKRLSTSALGDKTQANNGLTKSGDTVKLGGSLTAATTVTTTATNTLAVLGLQSGSLSDSLVVADATTGALKRLSTSALGDKTQANNGLSKSGDTVQLGGTLTKATIVTQSSAKDSLTFATGGNKLKITGLPSGSSSDSLLTLDANNVVKKIQVSAITTQPIRVVTGATTLTLNDFTVVLNSASAATFTLPAANTAKDKIYRIANHSYYSGNDITLSLPVKYGTGTSTSVDDMYVGGGLYTTSTVSTITIQSDGTDWWFIGR